MSYVYATTQRSHTRAARRNVAYTLVNYTNAELRVDLFVRGPALSPHFNPKHSTCASLCGLWPARLDNDLIGSSSVAER